MAFTSIPITPGSGADVAVDDVGGLDMQVVKLDVGATGVSKPVVQGGSNGLPVDVLTVLGSATALPTSPLAGQTWPISAASAIPVSDNSGSITVDAPVGTPVAVRLSDGSTFPTTLPVSGTVTGNQGAAAANSGGWPVLITDGISTAGLTNVGGSKAIKVDVIQSVALAGNQTDLSSFTGGSSDVSAVGAVYNDSITAPSSGQAGAFRMTGNRALHANLRKSDGTELGVSGNPVIVNVTGGTTQPVNGTVTSKIQDASGNPFAPTNPLPVELCSDGRTRITKVVTLASGTGTVIWTPSGSNKIFITKIIFSITGADTLAIYGNSNTAANTVASRTEIVANNDITFTEHWRTTAGGDVLKYDAGSSLAGKLTIHGYETA